MNPKIVQIKLTHGSYKNLIEFGKDHGIVSGSSDRVMPASVVGYIVHTVLTLHKNIGIVEKREQEGSTTMDIIKRAVHQYL